MTLVVNTLNRYIKSWLALIGLAFLLAGCDKAPQFHTLKLQGNTMGTYYVVKVVGNPDQLPDGATLQQTIDTELKAVNATLSTYSPQSEISLFNKAKQTDAIKISAPMQTVVSEALRIAKLSDGAFDPTVGPLVNLWGFGPQQKPEKIPSSEVLEATLADVGYQNLSLTSAGLAKAKPDSYLDFSAIAKGYGVDRVAELLASLGHHNYLVEIGGELRLKGHNDRGTPWRIAVEKPLYDGSQAVELVITPGDQGVATSGDYRNYFEENGVRYSHTINPATGRPIDNKVVSVTVVADTSMTADGLATAFTVMGVEKTLAYAEQANVAVMVIEKGADGFTEHHSQAFKPLLAK